MRMTPARIALAVGAAGLGLIVSRPTRGAAPPLFRDANGETIRHGPHELQPESDGERQGTACFTVRDEENGGR